MIGKPIQLIKLESVNSCQWFNWFLFGVYNDRYRKSDKTISVVGIQDVDVGHVQVLINTAPTHATELTICLNWMSTRLKKRSLLTNKQSVEADKFYLKHNFRRNKSKGRDNLYEIDPSFMRSLKVKEQRRKNFQCMKIV